MGMRLFLLRTAIVCTSLAVYGSGVDEGLSEFYAFRDSGYIARNKEDCQDNNKLRAHLMYALSISAPYEYREFLWMMENFSVSKERLRHTLTEIYHDADTSLKDAVDSPDRSLMEMRRYRSIMGLAACADEATKTFFLEMATGKPTDSYVRMNAILSYLRVADAEESSGALLRFLVGQDRMEFMERLSVYQFAGMAYDDADPANTAKRQAILAALLVAVNREEEKIAFVEVDRILSRRSDAYRRSRERLALLERHSLEPPTTAVHIDRDLKAALDEARKLKAYTTVNTNLAALQARDFDQPLPKDDWADLTLPPPENEPPQGRRIALYVLGGMTALVALAASGVWVLKRRRKASPP